MGRDGADEVRWRGLGVVVMLVRSREMLGVSGRVHCLYSVVVCCAAVIWHAVLFFLPVLLCSAVLS